MTDLCSYSFHKKLRSYHQSLSSCPQTLPKNKRGPYFQLSTELYCLLSETQVHVYLYFFSIFLFNLPSYDKPGSLI